MSTKEKLEERIFILECIKLYENLPALWNTKSKDYSNRDKKNQQYGILLSKYKQRYPNADKTDLIRKFNSLRTNFRKELKKIYDSKSDSIAEEPTLWYFDQMKFLLNIDGGCSYQNSMSDEAEVIEQEAVALTEDESKPKKKKLNSSTDELVRLATQRLKLPTGSCHQIGNVWGDKLSKMDRNQRIIAERVINEVMFNGELGLLTFNTALTNTNSVYNTNSSSSLHNRNKIIANSNESSIHSPNMSQYTSKEPNEQICSTSRLNYASSLLINTEAVTDHAQEDTEESFIVAEFDPLDNAIKMED